MTTITEADIDTVYDAIETLNVCRNLLANGDADSKAQGSVAWLLGSTVARRPESATYTPGADIALQVQSDGPGGM